MSRLKQLRERLKLLREISELKEYALSHGFCAIASKSYPNKYECYFNGKNNILTLEEVNLYAKHNVVYIVRVATKATKGNKGTKGNK